MSFNQPRSDKTEQHYRKTGRSTSFNQQRTTSGAYGKGAGGVPAPSPSLSSNRSFKKSNNVQGGQSSVTSPAVNSSNSPSVRNVQNGPHVHPPLHVNASPAAKPVESATTQRSTRAVSKAPTSQPATVSSDSTFPMTPSKASGDASKAFSVQFGSISPGFMNRMRVPARTSSIPPNLDEQKPAQARHDSSIRYVPNMPTPVPKQQQPWKDSVPTVQSNSGEAHPVPKVKKDAHASVASPTKQTQKPSHPTQMAFHHHQQVSMQFGGPNPQFQSPASIQLPIHMPLPMGNAPQVQQQVLVPGLQAHTLPPQGMMHQDQSLNFSPPIGAQLPPHLGNVGMDITPQYPQQQGGKFGVPRKASLVKVTHPGSFSPGRDLRLDLGYGAAAGFRPAQGGNFGVLRHPRGQAPLAYIGGILGGPKQPMGLQGGMPRNSPDSDRWQRATNYQHRGLVPSPQTPLQMMHKAERKYIVGIVAGEEESKQRQLKAILDKLTPQNFEKLFEQVKALNIDNAVTLTGVISQIFDKAVMESTFCEMYANLCYYLAGELPDFSEDNEKITFKRLLLNKCQEEFERGEREQEEANKVEEEGEAKQSEEEIEKRIKARRRMLGNIRLIGELYKKKMLTERIMHECIKKLLGEYENPDEEDVEALCKLMSTIGDMIDHPKAKVHMDAYFERIAKLSNNTKLSSRVRFMLKDSIDLRKNKWQQRRKVEGPKKIDEVHRDAAQERQAQTSRLARGPGMNAATRRAPMDFGPRGSMLSSPGSQMGSFRGMPNQVRGFGGQDARMDDRHSFEARTLSVPLPQRPIGDDSITLGPQGGLARGMAYRGVPGISSAPIADASPAPGDSRRVAAALNDITSLSERTTYGSREDLMPRYGTDRSAVPTDDSFDRAPGASAARGKKSSFTPDVPPEKGMSEERLHDMSMSTIKEFYSARDEKEVALCIKDLNSPSFHPSMIALFVTDSFERKDAERDLLAKLLVNLTRSNDGVLSQVELVEGFESVLSTLEDAVNDAPKAAEFLGRIFARLVIEDVVSLREIGRLIYDGGEEPGRLREIGLAGDVLGSTLGVIRTEKGESVLNEIRSSSNLRLEDFRPHYPNKSRLLETFI